MGGKRGGDNELRVGEGERERVFEIVVLCIYKIY